MQSNIVALIDQLIALRKSKKLSQQKLADMAGMLQPALARIESKRVAPALDSLCKLLEVMDAELVIREKSANVK